MTKATVELFAATKEALEVPIKVNADPTATPPAFSLTESGARTPGSFSNGSWVDAYTNATTPVTARTPTLGTSGTISLTAGTTYDLWVKVTISGEVAVWVCGRVRVP